MGPWNHCTHPLPTKTFGRSPQPVTQRLQRCQALNGNWPRSTSTRRCGRSLHQARQAIRRPRPKSMTSTLSFWCRLGPKGLQYKPLGSLGGNSLDDPHGRGFSRGQTRAQQIWSAAGSTAWSMSDTNPSPDTAWNAKAARALGPSTLPTAGVVVALPDAKKTSKRF